MPNTTIQDNNRPYRTSITVQDQTRPYKTIQDLHALTRSYNTKTIYDHTGPYRAEQPILIVCVLGYYLQKNLARGFRMIFLHFLSLSSFCPIQEVRFGLPNFNRGLKARISINHFAQLSHKSTCRKSFN